METVVDRLLAQFVDGGWSFVEALPSSGKWETAHIDFKSCESTDGNLRKSDRKNLSKALSGFANSDGGLLVWGIDARPNKDGYDKVKAVCPIQNLKHFVSSLNSIEPQSVSPLVSNVRHIPIASSANVDTGIAITVIPASDLTPHMATGKDLHCYFRRSGSSFIAMAHYEIADLFGRRPHPQLKLIPRWLAQSNSERGGVTLAVSLELHLTIQNLGRGSARFVSLSLSSPSGLQPDTRTGTKVLNSSLRVIHSARHWWVRLAASSEDLVYPEDEMSVGYLRFILSRDRQSYPDVSVRFGLVCDSAPVETGTIRVSAKDIQMAAQRIFNGPDKKIELDTA